MYSAKLKHAIPVFLLLISATFASARGRHPATGEVPKPVRPDGLEFIENKGQWVPEAKYMAEINGGVMFVTDKGFVYNYANQADLKSVHEVMEDGKDASDVIIHQHAYKVNFAGSNTGMKYAAKTKSTSYNNYFIGNDPAKWASNVGKFGRIEVSNIYNGINLAIYSKNNSPKYDFIVAAGADPGLIKLSFEGVRPQLDKEGNLHIKTSVNELKEQAPYVYQNIDGKTIAVEAKYAIDKDGNITFEFPDSYNKAYDLIIDPVLVFATYSGSTAGNVGYYSFSTTYDALGNMYAGCQAYHLGWPVTTGAFQTTFSGGQDVGVNKYNASGSALVYSTYYGGGDIDLPHSMFVNDAGELIVAGSTQSNNLPTTTGALDNTLGGNTDIFVAHFNVTGTGLVGATYLGGNNTEPISMNLTGGDAGLTLQNITSPIELLSAPNGDIWVVSSTSSANFPLSATPAQNTYAGGASDGVIVKLNGTCTQLLYSSYMGGTNADVMSGIQRNSAGDMVVTGSTLSTDFPITPGTLNAANMGGVDGFVSIINQNTGAIIAATYIGTNAADQAVNLQVDPENNIYILGRTLGNYPVTAGVYNIPGGDLFVDKLNPTLTTSLLSTRLGNQQSQGTRYFPTAFLLDICQNIYVCGLLANTGLPVTPDRFADETSNGRFWFGVLEPDFTGLLYGSYFGIATDHTHCGVNRLDPTGIVYHSICNNGQYPFIPPGSYAPVKQNNGQDIVSFKFNFEATGVNSNFELDPAISGNDTGCAPYQVHFINNSVAAEGYIWDFGDGTTSTLTEPTHTYTTAGTYNISLRASNPESCITDDTSYVTVTVLQVDPPDFDMHDTILCTLEQQIHVGATINNPSQYTSIQWAPLAGIIGASNTADITVDPTVGTTYNITVKNTAPGNICEFAETKTVNIDLSPRILDILNPDTVVCEGANVQITGIGGQGYTYRWIPSTGVSDSTALNPIITVNQPEVYTLTGSYVNCPDTSVVINIGMHYMPHLTISENKSVCQGTDVTLESNVTPFRNDYIYNWTPATANLTNPNGPNTHFIADSNITYILNVKSPIGCADADTVAITVYPIGFGSIVADTGYCSGTESAVNLWARGGTTYQWSPSYGLSDANIENPVASPPQTTEYTVLITDVHNCMDTEKVTVAVYPAAIIHLPDSVNIYPGENYQIQPETNGLYFSWFPTSGLNNPSISDPYVSPEVRTRYFVTAKTENGCVVKDSVDILVKETVIDMPNAFKPGNNANPVFKPARRGIAKLNSFTIYNRWGNKVYSSTNIDAGWDGTYNNVAQPMGVYIYVIDAMTDSGRQFIQNGDVTLIR